jgi:CDP-diacylglycerol--glycerol-3-phosphate 3-phosphatidyltransferase
VRTEITVLLALLGVALASMVAFRITAGAAVRTAEVARRGSFVFGDWIREWFYWSASPIGRFSVRARLAPEVFNAIGLLLGIASGVAYATGHLPLGGALLLASGATDAFDGLVARARGVVSTYGAFLDSTLDRFTEVAVFAGLAAYYREPVPVLVIVAGLGGSLLVSYTRARGESLGILCDLGVMQRAERLLLLGFGSVLDPTLSAAWSGVSGRPDPGAALLLILVVIAVGSLLTAVFRTVWISRRLRDGGGRRT